MSTVFPAPHERDARLSPKLLCPPTAQTYFLEDKGVFLKSSMPEYYETEYPSPLSSSTSSTIPSSPEFPPSSPSPPSYTPTISSPSWNTTPVREEDEIVLPSYDADDYSSPETHAAQASSNSGTAPHSTCDKDTSHLDRVETDFTTACLTAGDDSSIEEEPERHVDYLSHEWREEDIWASWRYVISRRNRYSNAVRLENASWRSWAKAKYNLPTVSPETLNWLKDCDVTWLYGPLQTDSKRPPVSNTTPSSSRLSSANSFLDRKSILKKKTASEAILQRSLSQHTLLKHAGAILQAQKAEHTRGQPNFDPSGIGVSLGRRSDYSFGSTGTNSTSSGLVSPSEKRHIHFNNEVVQCIAVEAKDGEDDDDDPYLFYLDQEDDDESDDGVVMMKQCSSKAPISTRSTPRNSFSSESKTIAPLPSTTLKYRGDTPEPRENSRSSPTTTGELSPSPSVETLRPPRPEANFLLDDEENDLDPDWQPNLAGYGSSGDRPWFVNPEDEDELESGALHFISSDTFMSYEEGESPYTGLFGRIVDTINTARDIAHVIWNVGWRR